VLARGVSLGYERRFRNRREQMPAQEGDFICHDLLESCTEVGSKTQVLGSAKPVPHHDARYWFIRVGWSVQIGGASQAAGVEEQLVWFHHVQLSLIQPV
jgi:hypothetical protein